MTSTIRNTHEEKSITLAAPPKQTNTTKTTPPALIATAATTLAQGKITKNEDTDAEIVPMLPKVAAEVENAKIDTKVGLLRKSTGTPTTGTESRTNA